MHWPSSISPKNMGCFNRVISIILIISCIPRRSSSPSFISDNLLPQYLRRIVSPAGSQYSLPPNLTSPCSEHLLGWLSQLRVHYGALENADNWALQMADSFGKSPEGILSGHISAMGDYDECLSVEEKHFKGRYCTNLILLPFGEEEEEGSGREPGASESRRRRSLHNLLRVLRVLSKSEHPSTPSIASCLPSTCTNTDTQAFLSSILPSLSPLVGYCYTGERAPLGVGSITMLILLSFILLLTISASLAELLLPLYYGINPPPPSHPILLSFSIIRNTGRLLSTTAPDSSFSCLHGLRFLSALWVVGGHTFYMYMLQASWNIVDIVEAPSTSFLTLLILNAGVVVDTFLTITGILVCYNVREELERSGGRLNVPLLLLRRYCRLTPMYALLLGCSATLFPLLSSGPKWIVVERWSSYCRRNWWHNLLYINNLDIYDPPGSPNTDNQQCFGEAWYLAVDMQLFLLSPLLLYPLWRWERVGRALLGVATALSLLVPGIITYIQNLPPTALPFIERGDFTHESYMVPWMRASPYLLGVWTGYLLHKTRGRPLILPKLLVWTVWVLTCGCGAAVMLGIQKWFDWRNERIPKVEGAIYSGAYHGVWGLMISWIVFACSRGYGGWIGRFLSWKVFLPLGRLSYAVYLVSLNLQFLFHFTYRQPIFYDMYQAINLAFAHMVSSLLAAYLISMTMEAPFIQLEKIATGRMQGPGISTALSETRRADDKTGEENHGPTAGTRKQTVAAVQNP